MIPLFPQFKKLEITDKEMIESFTKVHPPYSDFNFTSIWAWDTENSVEISQLNENLILLLNDYISNKPFLSFIGTNKTQETIQLLIKFSKKEYGKNYLKLLPEESIANIPKWKFSIKEDRGAFDYIYSIEKLAGLNSWSKHSLSQNIKRFLRNYPNYKTLHLPLTQINKNEHLDLFKKWCFNKKIKEPEKLKEFKAFQRILQLENQSIHVTSIYIETELIAFSIYEIISNKYTISHFIKTNTDKYPYSYEILNWEESKFLHLKGINFIIGNKI